MKRLPASEARDNFADTLNQVGFGKQRIVLHRRGKDLAVIVPLEDLALLEELENRQDLEDARAALIEAGEKGTTSLAALKKELDL